MKTTYILLIVLLSTFNVRAQAENNLAQAQQYMNSQQAGFEENKGQVTGQDAPKVKYTYKHQDLSVFLLNNGMAYQFNKTHYPEGYQQLDQFAERQEQEKMEELSKDIRVETYRMDVSLVGANASPSITTEGKSQDYTQYYNHNALDVHHYSKITYHNVYPNIDWVIYTQEGKGLKYDFVVHPGGDPAQIKLQTTSVEDLRLNQDGSLTLQNRMGYITEQTPISFQGEQEIKTNFTIDNHQITFNLSHYNPNQTLVIDPNLVWGTYYGGSNGGTIGDVGYHCSVDNAGNVYLAGETPSITSIASGGHDDTLGGTTDAFLVKFNSNGVRQWATYYGGISAERGYSCLVDSSRNVYLSGLTRSTSAIASGGHDDTLGGTTDAFLVKFNSAGVRQWATYYGGSDEEVCYASTIDNAGNVYLAGYTQSTLYIADNGHQNTYGGGSRDAFLVKFNADGVRQWATYYGGSGFDAGKSCAIDGSGNVYLAGNTGSTSAIASGGHQNTYGGGPYDAFLVKFNSNGVHQWATYYGGSEDDYGEYCSVGGDGNVYLAGFTESTSAIASGGHQNTHGGGTDDAFLVQFNSVGIRQWATYYGGSNQELGLSCAVDGVGNVYLTGYTGSTSSIASGGYQDTYGGGAWDAFLVMFNSFGVRQWGTYYGGSSLDFGWDCTVDGSGNVYLAGETASTSGIAYGGHQNIYGGGVRDAFLVKFDGGGVSVSNHEIDQPKATFVLYPNPASELLTLELSTPAMHREATTYQIFDLQGKVVLQGVLNQGKNLVNIAGLAKGSYLIRTESMGMPFEVVR